MNKYTCSACNNIFESNKKNRKYCSNKCVAEGNRVKKIKHSKFCPSCNTEKSSDCFWKRKGSINALHHQCIECEKKQRQDPIERSKYREYARKKKRIRCGLDPSFEGNYKTGPKHDPEKRHLSQNGYWLISRPGHPNCRNDQNKKTKNRIFEHVWVMSEYLGRPIRKGETIHHINGDKLDNRIENLELWRSGHPSGQRVEDKILWCKEFLNEYGYDVIKR